MNEYLKHLPALPDDRVEIERVVDVSVLKDALSGEVLQRKPVSVERENVAHDPVVCLPPGIGET